MLYDTIRELCDRRGINVSKLEAELGLSNGSIAKWNTSSPKADNLNKVAQYFDVSLDYLMGNSKTLYHDDPDIADLINELLKAMIF